MFFKNRWTLIYSYIMYGFMNYFDITLQGILQLENYMQATFSECFHFFFPLFFLFFTSSSLFNQSINDPSFFWDVIFYI